MAYISYNKIWESEFNTIVSKPDKIQDININQIKLEVHDSYKKDEKLSTDFERADVSDIINNIYLQEKLLNIDGNIACIEKDYSEFKLQNNKQSVKEVLIQRFVKTTIQIIYDEGLFDSFSNAEEAIKVFLFVIRPRGGLEENK